jgi:hypothetical protein
VISKILQPSKVHTKMRMLPCAHISFKINAPHTNKSPTPTKKTYSRPGGGGRHSVGTSALAYSLIKVNYPSVSVGTIVETVQTTGRFIVSLFNVC